MKESLIHCPLFEGIRAEELDGMLSCLGARRQTIGQGCAIIAQGEEAGRLGMLLWGSAQVEREDFSGNRSILARLEAGDLFAEAFVCAAVPVMPVSVVAVEPSEALLMDGSRLLHPCSNACGFHQRLIYNLMKILATKNLMCNRKIEVISKRSTREKLMAYLWLEAAKAQSSTFTIPYDRQGLADYLEVDRSGLSAEISKLRREGVIKCERSRFTLLAEREAEPWTAD